MKALFVSIAVISVNETKPSCKIKHKNNFNVISTFAFKTLIIHHHCSPP